MKIATCEDSIMGTNKSDKIYAQNVMGHMLCVVCHLFATVGYLGREWETGTCVPLESGIQTG